MLKRLFLNQKVKEFFSCFSNKLKLLEIKLNLENCPVCWFRQFTIEIAFQPSFKNFVR